VEKGTPKSWAKTADTGSEIVSYFCGNCGTTLWRQTPTLAGLIISKAGIYEGDELQATPDMELFAPNRLPWLPAIPGAKQVNAMS
jgi:hypothetical protein